MTGLSRQLECFWSFSFQNCGSKSQTVYLHGQCLSPYVSNCLPCWYSEWFHLWNCFSEIPKQTDQSTSHFQCYNTSEIFISLYACPKSLTTAHLIRWECVSVLFLLITWLNNSLCFWLVYSFFHCVSTKIIHIPFGILVYFQSVLFSHIKNKCVIL